jgi:hypothetical protein
MLKRYSPKALLNIQVLSPFLKAPMSSTTVRCCGRPFHSLVADHSTALRQGQITGINILCPWASQITLLASLYPEVNIGYQIPWLMLDSQILIAGRPAGEYCCYAGSFRRELVMRIPRCWSSGGSWWPQDPWAWYTLGWIIAWSGDNVKRIWPSGEK